MFWRESSCRLQLNDQTIIDVQIDEILTNAKSIIVVYFQGFLSLYLVASLLKPMLKCGFIDLLKQSRTKIFMHSICYLSHLGR